ncbi:hypothetical protein D1872_238590 [compost metagenome]
MPRYIFSGLKQRIRVLANPPHDFTCIGDQTLELPCQLSNLILGAKLHIDGQVTLANLSNVLSESYQRAGQDMSKQIDQQHTEQDNSQCSPDHRKPVLCHQLIDGGRIQICPHQAKDFSALAMDRYIGCNCSTIFIACELAPDSFILAKGL